MQPRPESSIEHLHGRYPVGPLGRAVARGGGRPVSVDPGGMGVVLVSPHDAYDALSPAPANPSSPRIRNLERTAWRLAAVAAALAAGVAGYITVVERGPAAAPGGAPATAPAQPMADAPSPADAPAATGVPAPGDAVAPADAAAPADKPVPAITTRTKTPARASRARGHMSPATPPAVTHRSRSAAPRPAPVAAPAAGRDVPRSLPPAPHHAGVRHVAAPGAVPVELVPVH